MTLLRRVLGETLRGRRLRQRRTLREVSGAARVSLGYLSEVERGRKEPSSELLAAICEALDVALPDLLTDAARTMAGEAVAMAPRLPIGLRQADLRLAGPEPTPVGAPLGTPVAVPLPPARPVARAAA
jgi:transcriptional regulator with XRE-family HTH domain